MEINEIPILLHFANPILTILHLDFVSCLLSVMLVFISTSPVKLTESNYKTAIFSSPDAILYITSLR